MLRFGIAIYCIFILHLFIPQNLLGGNQVEDTILNNFLNEIKDKDNDQKIALFDSLIPSLLEIENSDTVSSLLLDIYSRAKLSDDKKLVSKSIFTLSTWYLSLRQIDLALNYLNDILLHNDKIDFIDSIRIYDQLTYAYFNLEIHDKCLESMMMRDNLLNSADSATKVLYSSPHTCQIGDLYWATGMYHEAISETKKHLKKILANDNSTIISTYLNNIGVTWERANEPDSALYYFNEARRYLISDTATYKASFLGLVEGNIGEVLMLKNEFDTAMILIKKDIECSRQIENYGNVAISHIALANCYLHVEEPSLALICLDSAQKYMKWLVSFKPLSKYYFLRSEVFEALKNPDSALFYTKKYISYTDSVHKVEKESKIISNQIAFDTKKKEMQISQQKDELLEERTKVAEEKAQVQKQTNIRNISLLGFLFLLIMFFVILRSHRKQKKSKLVLEEKNQRISTQAENLVSANNKLKELDRFKKSMTSMIAHDLKNPLNTVINLAHNSGNEKQKQIAQAGNNMLNLVMNLLDVNKYEKSNLPLNIEAHPAREIIENAIDRVALLLENKAIEINTIIDNEISILADKENLERVFVNLLTNAIKYSHVNSTITIAARQNGEDWIRFMVKDEGEGVKMENKDKLFELFYQSNAKKSGNTRSSGLGLTFCKMAIEAHGGTIGIESHPGRGSEFWFTLKRGDCTDSSRKVKSQKIEYCSQIGMMSKQEIKKIMPVLNDLREVEYYEVTRINSLINKLSGNSSEAVLHWVKDLRQAVATGNDKRYHELTNINKTNGE